MISALFSVLGSGPYLSARNLGLVVVGSPSLYIHIYMSNEKVSATKNLQGRLMTSHKMRQNEADEPNRWDGNGEEVTVIRTCFCGA